MSKYIKTITYHLFTICLVLGFSLPNTLNATHIVGGDISYRCLGDDLYEITLTVRRDCENGAEESQFDDPAAIGIYDIFGTLLVDKGTSGRLYIPFMGDDTITNERVFDCSAIGSAVCVHEAVYRDTLELPYNKLGYILAYQRCCRNSSLVNIENPLETGATYYVEIPIDVLTECNSQPVFNEWADVYLCVNDDISFDHSATEIDGDVLIYKLCTPSKGASINNPQPVTPSNPPYDEIDWASSYSVNNMLTGNPPFSINQNTGLLTGRPSQVGTYLIGICVEEYRNGEKISEVRRDFEYNVRMCGDPILVDFNVSGNDCDGDTQVTFDNLTQGADEYNWTIVDAAGVTIFSSSDEDFTFDFPNFGTYNVILEGIRNSDGCIARKEQSITIGNPNVIADFEVLLPDCVNGGIIELFDLSTDPSGSSFPVSWEWIVDGNQAPSTNPSSIVIGTAQNFNVTLNVTFNSGCTASITKPFQVIEPTQDINFTYSVNSCDPGFVELNLNAFTNGSSPIIDVSWSVEDMNGVQQGNTNPYNVSILNQDISVTIEATFENGCTSMLSRTIAKNDILPELVILNNYQADQDCVQGSETLEVRFGAGFIGAVINANIISYEWLVNGESFSTEEIELNVQNGEIINLSLAVTYDNGCVITDTSVFTADFAPAININVLLDCSNSTGLLVTLSDQTNYNGDITYSWFLDQVLISTNDNFEFFVGPNGNQVDLTVEFDNGCIDNYSQFFTPLENPDYTYNLEECRDSSVVVSLTNIGGTNANVTWEINEDGTINNYSGSTIQFEFSAEQIQITQIVDYGNGCILSETTTLTQNDVLPDAGDIELEYTIIPVECVGDSGIFVFTDMTDVPECIFILSRVWIINGQVCEGSPITKTLPLGEEIDFSFTITFSDGTVISTSDDSNPDNDSINTNDLVDIIEIDIVNNSTSNCSDSLDLLIVNPMTGVDYEWSTDSDFINIIGTGIDYVGVGGDLFTGTIYVQTINNIGPCVYGQESIIIESDAINISYDMPFILCPGDTANFNIINNNPDQTLTYEWKGGDGQLIEGGNNPLIGVADDATEDFFYVLCTTNNFGCTSSDTINFSIRENEELQPFAFEQDSCGSLTVNFDESPNDLNGNGIWVFGDGSTGFGSEVSHTYEMPGLYEVSLIDTSSICPKDPITLDVNVGELTIEILESINDTIIYSPDFYLEVTVATNGNDEDVTWCLEDGTNVGSGNPLVDYFPEMDTVTLIAKIVDEFGCTGSDTVVLVIALDIIVDDCFESVTIDGPDPAVVCENEEFTLTVVFEDNCVIEDFEYLWNPEDCIISGQGTPTIVASISEAKTIMVLVTHPETGLDSIFTFDIEVSNPMVNVMVPELNIDTEGNPFVCLGQSIILFVDPADPNCTYTWNDGQMGESIEVSPEETTTYSVTCVDEFNCSSETSEITVPVILPQCNSDDIYIPNAFSPNGDSNNDVLYVRSKFITSMELSITNRWGEEVFLSTDQNIGWDGTYKGETLAPDVYAYCVKATCNTGDEYVKAGNVSLIK